MTIMRFRRLSGVCLLLFVVCTPVIFSGCSGKKARAVVKGKVTFAKKSLTAGTVSFVAADGRNGSSIIKSDGTYAVNDAPVGDVTITVTTPTQGAMPATKPPPGMKGMPKEFLPPDAQDLKAVRVVPAPEKYSKVETSTLKFKVETGSQDHDIDLTP